MSVALIDYGSGNLRSAAKAFERAIAEAEVPLRLEVTADPGVVAAADRIVLPGVGAFADCRRGLMDLPGMADALFRAVVQKERPFLGICVGMQLMATTGREHGDHPGLDWVGGIVDLLPVADNGLKIPHMGWNDLTIVATGHPVLAGIATGAHAYFVHSYGFRASDPRHVLATAAYGGPIAAVVGRDNLIGTQFHPEKSQATGLRLIGNFLRWRP